MEPHRQKKKWQLYMSAILENRGLYMEWSKKMKPQNKTNFPFISINYYI